jgi:hypothetical protein
MEVVLGVRLPELEANQTKKAGVGCVIQEPWILKASHAPKDWKTRPTSSGPLVASCIFSNMSWWSASTSLRPRTKFYINPLTI